MDNFKTCKIIKWAYSLWYVIARTFFLPQIQRINGRVGHIELCNLYHGRDMLTIPFLAPVSAVMSEEIWEDQSPVATGRRQATACTLMSTGCGSTAIRPAAMMTAQIVNHGQTMISKL